MSRDIKIQNIILPYSVDANLRAFYEFMCRSPKRTIPLCFDPEKNCHILPKFETAEFSTYFNALQISRWKKFTCAKSFSLHLTFKGKIAVEFMEMFRSSVSVNYAVLGNKIIENAEKNEIVIKLPDTQKELLTVNITALEDAEIYCGHYSADVDEKDIRDIKLSLVTTTFKKQEYIKKNIAILKSEVLCEGSDLKDHLFIHVIDNERALNPTDYNCDGLKVYPNDNVGGAGGFTRGMIEAMELEKPATHVLLMDDDVMIMSESLFRTYYLLRIVKDEHSKRFISGAMFDYDIRERQYEDVGYINKATAAYGPIKPKLDMRWPLDLVANEAASDIEIQNSYAGWWFCCIPVTHIKANGLPIPVFVRGDDVEFSLRNNPGFITLNGISIWHVGFAGKFNAAMELYQVHRNSLIVQAASGICSDVDFVARIKPLFWKELTRFAYNNSELLLDAIEDFMRGPDYMTKLNGEQSLKEHAAKNEKLVSAAEIDYPQALSEDPYVYKSMNILSKGIYVLTINGHLLPNFLLRRYPGFISFDWFFCPAKNFLRQKLVAINANDRTACVRTISRKRCFSLIKRYNTILKNYKKNHTVVEQEYKSWFSKMTSVEFWKDYLKYDKG